MEFYVMQILSGDGSEYFNYFFTLTMVMGGIGFGAGLLVNILSRS